MRSKKKTSQNIDFNKAFEKAYNLMENTNKSLYITGKAGTGKSTLLQYFRNNTKKHVVILAPTGVAAVNVKGQTIHSFFGFHPKVTPERIYRWYDKDDPDNVYAKVDALVIDEISMVRADLLDCIDKFMRLNGGNINVPFGGVQMIFIGDLFQLPPVVTEQDRQQLAEKYDGPYFFDANVFKQFPIDLVELTKIYRQKDQDFIDLLNTIRTNTVTEEELSLLNEQYDPDFEPNEDEFIMYLASTNAIAQQVNDYRLSQLEGRMKTYTADVTGDFQDSYFPTDLQLSLKEGAQVMMMNNDIARRWHNGSLGKVIGFERNESGDETIKVLLENGKEYDVEPNTWDAFSYVVDSDSGEFKEEPSGSFTQYPMKLAWAVTIHKSQGKTFERVVIDIGFGTFAHGQMYVALSRCTSLRGIRLKKKIQKRHVIVDQRVVSFSS